VDRVVTNLDHVETRFLERQAQVHLMEAHVALVKAAGCVLDHGSEVEEDIDQALGYVDSALGRS
jgi:hypothetical protein